MPLVCAHEDMQTVSAAALSSDNAKTGRYTLDLGSSPTVTCQAGLNGCVHLSPSVAPQILTH